MTAIDPRGVFEGFRIRVMQSMPPGIGLVAPGDLYPNMDDFLVQHTERQCARLPAFCTGDGARWSPGDPIYP